MAKLRVTLKQHTPLIHFQSEQDGAILRATEFKPKLDKFLIKHAFEGDFEKYKQYLVGYRERKTKKDFDGKEAFNYKVRFSAKEKINVEDIKSDFPLYFSNMGKDDNSYCNSKKNKFVFCDSLDLELFSINKFLLDIIAKELPLFLMKNNFEQRQSKGFGSFFINDENIYYIDKKECKYEKNKIESIKNAIDSFFVNCSNTNNTEDYLAFSKIEKLYKKIRSEGNSYIKRFFSNKNIVCEKDVISDRFVNKKDVLIENAYLIKDLMGLSMDEEWKDKKGNAFRVKKENIADENKIKIERMQSPIFFKPLKDENGNFRIYVMAKSIPEEFFEKRFKIEKCVNKNIVEEFEISTPSKEKFNIKQFFEFVKTNENIQSNASVKKTIDNSNVKRNNYKNRDNRKNFKTECAATIGESLNDSKLEELYKLKEKLLGGEIIDSK